jgi:hypothetical protein
MTEREAMKLALEALEYIHEGANNQGPHTGISWRCVSNKAEPVITALRERLAHPEAPVLTGIDCSCGRKWRIVNNTLTASEPETVMAEYKFQTYAAYKTDGEMKIGVVPEPEQEPVCAHGVGKTKCDFCKQPAQPYKGIADHTNQATNGRLKIDPVTGDVGIGTPIAEPVQEPVAYIEHHKAAGEE